MKTTMDEKQFRTFLILIAMDYGMSTTFKDFTDTFRLTPGEQELYTTIETTLRKLIDSIIKRLGKRIITDNRQYIDSAELDIHYREQAEDRMKIFENAWEHTCRECNLQNWKACRTRIAYVRNGMPDVNGKGEGCPYRMAE